MTKTPGTRRAKKLLITFLLAALAALSAFVTWHFASPEKRFTKHSQKARILIAQGNLPGARAEFKTAYDARGGYSPTVTEEVLLVEVGILVGNADRDRAIDLLRAFVDAHPDATPKVRLLLVRYYLDKQDFEAAFRLLDKAIADPKGGPAAREMLADMRMRQGRADLAEQQYRELAKALPDSVRPLLLLASSLQSQHRNAEQRDALYQAARLDPRNQTANLALVDSWIQDRRIDSAWAVLNRWEKIDPARTMAISVCKAGVFGYLGRFDSAQARLRPYLDFSKEHTAPHLAHAMLLAAEGRYAEAAGHYDSIAAAYPALKGFSESMAALILIAGRKPAEALGRIKVWDPALEKPPSLKAALLGYYALGQTDKFQEALAHASIEKDVRNQYAEAFAGALADQDYMGDLALIYFFDMGGQPAFTIKACEKFQSHYPANLPAITLLASQYRKLGRPDLAYAVLAKMPAPTPQQRLTKARLMLETGKPAEAAGELQRILAAAPTLAGVNLLLADCYLQQGQPSAALKYYLQELNLDGGNIVALNNVAWQYGVQERDLRKAEPYLARLRSKAQSDPRILDTIGWILALNGQSQEGEATLRQAAALLPDQPSVLYHLAFAEQKLGKSGDAKANLKKALAAGAPWAERDSAAVLLNSLP